MRRSGYDLQARTWLCQRENQIDALKRTVDWFQKYLKPISASSSGK